MDFPQVFAIAVLFLLAGCIAVPENGAPSLAPVVEIRGSAYVSPEKEFCVSRGYIYLEKEGATGINVSYCVFPSGVACEAWAYYFGQCSERAQLRVVYAQEGEFCGGLLGLPCSDGFECRLNANYPDSGGICMRVLKFIPCNGKMVEFCSMQYAPVCGRAGTTQSTYNYEDYTNACVACSPSSPATGYVEGSCFANGLEVGQGKNPNIMYDCPSKRAGNCSDEYDPVCGRYAGGTADPAFYQDYRNPCKACSADTNVIGYYVGTCEGRK